MGELLSYGIAPHGFSIIEEISGEEKELFRPIREQMKILGKTLMQDKPDTIVILTPHGLRLKGYHAIYTTAYCRGSLSGFGQTVSLDYRCDVELANDILDALNERELPVVGCNYGALNGDMSNIPMDWGTLIPLWFCQSEIYQPEIVVIGPTRDVPLDQHVLIGEIIAATCLKSNKRIAVIASADQGHCHDENGPYGYHSASKNLDAQIMTCIEENCLKNLMDIEEALIANGKPDSIWQMLILEGILNIEPKKGKLLIYDVPTYFGMAVAIYD